MKANHNWGGTQSDGLWWGRVSSDKCIVNEQGRRLLLKNIYICFTKFFYENDRNLPKGFSIWAANAPIFFRNSSCFFCCSLRSLLLDSVSFAPSAAEAVVGFPLSCGLGFCWAGICHHLFHSGCLLWPQGPPGHPDAVACWNSFMASPNIFCRRNRTRKSLFSHATFINACLSLQVWDLFN